MAAQKLTFIDQLGDRGWCEVFGLYFLILMELDDKNQPTRVKIWRADKDGNATTADPWLDYPFEPGTLEQAIRDKLGEI
jgi:hypothetical protein